MTSSVASYLRYVDMVESVLTLKSSTKSNVALVVPVYNNEELLQDLLDAIKKQTIVPDIIVVDNGSSHPLSRIPKVRDEVSTVIRLRNNYGPSGGYYAGMYFALRNNYEVIILSDVDAIPLSSDLIQREIEMLSRGYDYVLPINIIYMANRVYTFYRKESLAPAQYLAIKAEILRKAGVYDPCLYFGLEDFDLCLRLRKYGKFTIVQGATYLHYFNNQRISTLLPLTVFRNSFLFGLRKKGRLSGAIGALRADLLLLLYSTICGLSLLRTTLLGVRIFVANIMGGVKGTFYHDLLVYSGMFSMKPLFCYAECDPNTVCSLDVGTMARIDGSIRLVHPFELGCVRAHCAYLSSWAQFALANLNPWIRIIRRVDFNPKKKQIVQFEFRSVGKYKALSWLRLVVNAPFFLSLIPILILGAAIFRDHGPAVHD